MRISLGVALAASLATFARAQSEDLSVEASRFESAAAAVIQANAPVDPFAASAECAVLDQMTIRPWSLEEASDLAAPCLRAVGRALEISLQLESGLVASADGREKRGALYLKSDLLPGSQNHRDLASALTRRGGRLLGHPVRLLTRGETDGTPVSSMQGALSQCLMTAVVRDLRSSEDFVRIYGKCLTRNPGLKIAAVRPAPGLMVTVRSGADGEQLAALSGSVIVNAGRGPVRVLIVAVSSNPASR
jgi:hypothetical protein